MKSMKRLAAIMIAVLMAISVIPAFAAETGKVRLELLDANRNPIDSLADLEGDMFYVPVIVSDFNGKLMLSEIALKFDPSQVKLVNTLGNEITSEKSEAPFVRAIENEAKVFDEELGDYVNVFKRVTHVSNNTLGIAKVTFYADPELSHLMGGNKYYTFPEDQTEYTAYIARFKIVEGTTGQIDISIQLDKSQLHSTKIYFSDPDASADMEDITDYDIFKLGDEQPEVKKVVSFAEKSLTVAPGTSKEEVIALLGDKIEATLDDNSTVEFTVAWDSEDYNADVAGEYTFTGTVEAIEGVDLDGKQPVAKVTVAEAVEAVYAVEDLEFTVGDYGAVVKFNVVLLDEEYVDEDGNDKVVITIAKLGNGGEVPVVVFSGKVSTTDGAQYTLSDVQEGETYIVHVGVVDGFELPLTGGSVITPLSEDATETAVYQAE